MWVSSHCGRELNDAADEMAKTALMLPIDRQLRVPVEFHDARALLKRRNKEIRHDFTSVPEAILKETPRRRVSTLLNQLYTKPAHRSTRSQILSNERKASAAIAASRDRWTTFSRVQEERLPSDSALRSAWGGNKELHQDHGMKNYKT